MARSEAAKEEECAQKQPLKGGAGDMCAFHHVHDYCKALRAWKGRMRSAREFFGQDEARALVSLLRGTSS